MQLRELLNNLTNYTSHGSLDVEVSAICDDSRQCQQDSMYVAIVGTHNDGHAFIEQAIANQAKVIVVNSGHAIDTSLEITWLCVEDTSKALGKLAAAWYHFPSQDLKVVGITGTNGKTTTSWLTHHIFKTFQHQAGLIGTIEFDDGLQRYNATHTTPSQLVLQQLLYNMDANGCRSVAMEVSSHALQQGRVSAVDFDVAVFSNLTQDHLDYHGNMDNYFNAKALLFKSLAASRQKKPVALINIDDYYAPRLIELLKNQQTRYRTYGYGVEADYRIIPRVSTALKSEFELQHKGKSYLVHTQLLGRFNLYNCIAALASANLAGIPLRQCIEAIAQAPQVPGRLELIGRRHGVQVFVDYAHTPDALQNVCSTLKELGSGRLICVFGCGGNRDKSKRPLMGKAASQLADVCIVSSDNPRDEKPEDIIKDILPGLTNRAYKVIVDRNEAIRVAIELARPSDIVLIAGKGHESYQEIAGEKHPFSDAGTARYYLNSLRDDDVKR